MAMAACCSISSSAAAGALRASQLQASRGRNRLSERRSGDICVGRGGNSRRFRDFEMFKGSQSGSSSIDSVSIRASAGGDGEDETERPRTMSSSKKRPKSMSSVVDRPAVLSEKRAGPKEKARSSNLISALVDDLAGFMAPREKGDIRDVVLMSLSFAVLIYISQHLVHAYCALRHTLQPFHHF
ncbi:hypothetical protein MPTK1_5g14160 [Marchantia polymorpha subsp. ruderalis]|nr:hypothetical protein MARPO_0032s0107 [Marchantia polymorpha]BBN11711.1 hypothetical protein Mp_5g14160 [Marchantia polymorpha subsp. ruderalis]|eukprot:PTQ41927.1 hypothetical protein MARPO_0032s0107 [Marchantia polymorpha]